MQECSICLDEIVSETTGIVSMACGHNYHMSCISRWLTTTPSCPECRHVATTKELPYNSQQTQARHDDDLVSRLLIWTDRTNTVLPFIPMPQPAPPVQHDVDIPRQDIDIVVQQSQVSYDQALTALKRYNGDIVDTIMYLTSITPESPSVA